MAENAFTPAIEGIKRVKSDGDLLTKPFLDVCKVLLPILEKLGPTLTAVRNEINGNITRLESKHNSDETRFNNLFNFVEAEIETKSCKSSSSCTQALLWLTRTMDFLVELFHNLKEHQDWSVRRACRDAYGKTIKRYHNWLDSSSFSVGMKLAPDRKKVMEVLGSNNEEIYVDIEKFCTTLTPILEDIHTLLISVNMNEL